jgi:hypothetical protein
MKTATAASVRIFCQSKAPEDAATNWKRAIYNLSQEPNSNDRAWFYLWCYRNVKVITKNGATFYLAPHGFVAEAINVSPDIDSKYIKTLELYLIKEIHIPDPTKLYQKLGIF